MKTIAILAAAALSLGAQKLELKTLSGRPDMVTGGQALVTVVGPGMERMSAKLDGRDITSAFKGGIGRVEGLKIGKNTLVVRAGGKRARLVLVNHPISGPVFSGPHQKPFVCQTEASGLGPALDADCSAKTVSTYHYRSTAGGALKQFDPAKPPSDVAQTTTSEGKSVPFIVRRESGTINRAVYQIAFLHQPGTPLPDPWSRPAGWNGRLVYAFGGGCRAGYRQGRQAVGLDAALLGAGYATAASSLNVFGNDCNDVISAETAMMVKEHFIESFGLPVRTIGMGGSGGSMQQHLIAQNYPGLLDGITPASSYPDIVSLIGPVTDCTLLDRAFNGSAHTWTEEQKVAVSGYATWKTCGSWNKSFSPMLIQPGNCDPSVPKGTRCGIHDNLANVFGRDAKTGLTPRPLDNVGVQYGLGAFNSGRITADQFIDLNQRIGGYDADGNPVAARTVADAGALRTAYQTGRVNSGGGDLRTIPTIDYRNHVDSTGDIHDSVRTRITRARLGDSANRVALMNPRGVNVVMLMDRWLDSVAKGQGRPADIVDACWTRDGDKVTDATRCAELYPAASDPRLVAGQSMRADILKCQLKPIDRADYKQPLTDDQIGRLRAVFPGGVCDYSKPGVEQSAPRGTWLRY